jgi:hypothetical protein
VVGHSINEELSPNFSLGLWVPDRRSGMGQRYALPGAALVRDDEIVGWQAQPPAKTGCIFGLLFVHERN